MRLIHHFDTIEQYEENRTMDYTEPWLSLTEENWGIHYNMDEEEAERREEEKKRRILSTPLTFEVQSNGNITWKANNTAYTVTLEYSKNGGEWTSVTSSTGVGTSISVVSGDTVQFRAPDGVTYGTMTSGRSTYNSFVNTSCKFAVKGNIMSLLDGTNFSGMTTLPNMYTFYILFWECTGLTDASELVLPATTLATACYYSMFSGCTSLTTAPELPATTLTNSCYYGMFGNCASLTSAPALPATTLAYSCYQYMFEGCISLTQTPELSATTLAEYCYCGMLNKCKNITTIPSNYLPVTTIASGCYGYMFANCTRLTSVPSDLLPATKIASECYSQMFLNCSGLTTAPDLPAINSSRECYYMMFSGCKSLNYVKCLMTNISSSYCTYNWLENVASTGTFVKAPSMTSWTTGNNGIPTGWTVQDAS